MASLDGHSLNQKIDKLHSEIVKEIEDMQMAFGQLYSYLKDLEVKYNKPVKKKKAKPKKEGAKNA
jgi:hypothetical protein